MHIGSYPEIVRESFPRNLSFFSFVYVCGTPSYVRTRFPVHGAAKSKAPLL